MKAKAPVSVRVYVIEDPARPPGRRRPAGGGGSSPVWFTPIAAVDREYWRRRGFVPIFLSGPLPAAEAARLVHRLRQVPAEQLRACYAGPYWRRWWFSRRWRWRTGLRPHSQSELWPALGWGRAPAREHDCDGDNDADTGTSDELPPAEETVATGELVRLLAGRVLTWNEIRREVEGAGIHLSARALTAALQLSVLRGQVRLQAGMEFHQNSWRCSRCGSPGEPAFFCPACGRSEGACLVCRECAALGAIRFCSLLYHAPVRKGAATGPASGTVPPRVQLPFELTAEQQEAARALLAFCREPAGLAATGPEGPSRRGLVQAVCGAGKTEVTLPAILEVIGRGGKVLFAVPRREVVVELASRFRRYLPGLDIVALYGGSDDRWEGPPGLTVATTHQLLRFRQAFDLAILDEADAFPYRGNPLLERALRRATRPDGLLVYLTATPDREVCRSLTTGEGGTLHVSLTARPHGHPLPEPVLLERRSPAASRALADLWRKALAGDPVFVFVPRVSELAKVAQSIRAALAEVAGLPANRVAGVRVETCHAHDPERQEKIESFRERRIGVLVTTTVMERGVTIPRAHVVVWGADQERIFDRAALVQMAGRAGRSREAPQGIVLFLAEHRFSRSMEEAYETIRQANQAAARRGMLSPSTGPEAE